MKLAITPTEAAHKAQKRFERIHSRFKQYAGSALHDAAVAFKMHWIEGINVQKYDSRFAATWYHTPVYDEWKEKQTGTPQFGLLDGNLIRAIEKYKINDLEYGVRLSNKTGVRHWNRSESYSIKDYAWYLEYGRKNKKSEYSKSYQARAKAKGWPDSPGYWAQKPRPIFAQTKLSYIWYWNKFLKTKFGKGWPSRIADGAMPKEGFF
jgi:hypothetical protein